VCPSPRGEGHTREAGHCEVDHDDGGRDAPRSGAERAAADRVDDRIVLVSYLSLELTHFVVDRAARRVRA